ncbi:RNA-directed DNA polymerase, eukaryota, reverse transcriptase zinc-binding domain protein [Tanacetum coccineum]
MKACFGEHVLGWFYNVSLLLNIWEPGISLEKVKPSTILIWFYVYNIPMELCNGNGIGKIMSRIGKPMLMDKMTKERCLKKSRKLDFSRVLVEVSVDDEFPSSLEIAYPPVGNRPARVRPRYEEEIAAQTIKEAINVKGRGVNVNGGNIDNDDGFVIEVGKINRLLLNPILCKLEMVIYLEVEVMLDSKVEVLKVIVDFRPKVLVRGSGSNGVSNDLIGKDVPIYNSFVSLVKAGMVEIEGTFVNKKKKLSGIFRRVFGSLGIGFFNGSSCDGGTRIIVGWDPRSVNVMVIEQASQVMHCFVELINGCDSFHCSFVYANMKSMKRRSLWRSLMKYKCSVGGTSWVVLGDFNVSIDPSKKSSVCSKITTDMCDFKECLANIKAEDIAMTGLHFT